MAAVFSNRPADCIVHPSGCFGRIGDAPSDAYNVGGFGDSGFANTFRDSKYLVPDQISNQVSHTLGGGINFAASGDNHYEDFTGLSLIRKTNYEWLTFHETSQKGWAKPDPYGNCGSSWEDLFSSYIGIQMGQQLRAGLVAPKDFGNLIRSELGYNEHNLYIRLFSHVPESSEWDIQEEDIDFERFTSYHQQNDQFDQDTCPGEYL